MRWILENQTKLLGVATSVLGVLALAAASGQLEGLISAGAIKWIALLNMLVGGLTGRAGFSNATKIKVAEAKVEVATAVKAAVESATGQFQKLDMQI